MYISINHRTEKFMAENYKLFTNEEFIDYVGNLAKSVGVEEIPDIHFYKESEGAIGVCFTAHVQGKTEVLALGFHDKILDGKTYSIHQVNEVIKHELAHMIADLRYNDNCQHDERFIRVVQEIGGEPSETLSLFKNSVTFHTEKLKEEYRTQLYTFSCSNCGTVHKRTSEYEGVFQLFALSGTESPLIHFIKMGDIGCKSPCCNTHYVLETHVQSLLAGLVKDGQLNDFQEHLKALLAR